MNIIEALRHNRTIKRKSWDESMWGVVVEAGTFHFFNRNDSVRLTRHDLLADDWEVQEERRELTWAQVISAYDLGHRHGRLSPGIEDCYRERVDLHQKLGFKE